MKATQKKTPHLSDSLKTFESLMQNNRTITDIHFSRQFVALHSIKIEYKDTSGSELLLNSINSESTKKKNTLICELKTDDVNFNILEKTIENNDSNDVQFEISEDSVNDNDTITLKLNCQKPIS